MMSQPPWSPMPHLPGAIMAVSGIMTSSARSLGEEVHLQ